MNAWLRNNRILILVAAVIILAVLLYSCTRSKTASTSTKEGFNGGNNQKKLMFFRAEWCGHCTRFKPVWDEFVSECTNTKMFPHVQIVELDIDQESTKPLMAKHNVGGFPHVVLTDANDENDVVYSGNRTKEDLIQFLQSQA